MYIPGNYLVNTSNLSAAEEILGKAYGRMRITHAASDSEPWLRIWRTRVGPVTLDDAEINSTIRCEIEAPRGVVLCRVRAGRVEFDVDGQRTSYERGDVVAIASDGMVMSGVMANARCDLVSFDRTFVNQAAKDFGDGESARPTQRFARPDSPPTGQLVADVIDHIRHFIANNAHVAGEPLIVGSAARYLMATALTAFPTAAFAT